MSTHSPSKPNSPTKQDTALTTRIVTHMNADHHVSLTLFLRHYNRLPASHAATAHLASINNDHMLIDSSYGRCLVPFNPPLTSLSDSRPRLIAMHQECLAGLNLSDTVLDTWTPPTKALHLFFFVSCLLIFTCFPRRANFLPDEASGGGGIVYSFYSVGGLVPGLAALSYAIQPWFLPMMVGIHGTETVVMAQTRLRKYNVRVGSGVWWAWMVDTFIEGFGCFERIDGIVKGKEGPKEKEKH